MAACRSALLIGLVVVAWALGQMSATGATPNIVYILADDMGLGDIRAYNANSPVNTPNIDSIANAGMKFTHASSSASVCTPTRYGILTGRDSWRGSLQSGVLGPFAPSIVEPARTTVAEMLQQSGYATAAIGKWHLGLNWTTTGGPANGTGTNVDYTQPFTGGPTSNGFDSYYGDDVINYPPYTMIRDNKTIGIPVGQGGGTTAYTPPGGSLPGYVTPGYSTSNVLPLLVTETSNYIASRATQPSSPFFLYLPLTAPHEPILPPPFLQGSTGTNSYGDFIATVDWAVGQVLGNLADPDHNPNTNDSILDNTLIVFTSDNGAENDVSFSTSQGFVNGVHLRGDKATVYEGGFHMPMITQWNGHIQAGSTYSSMVGTEDFMATVADIVGYQLPTGAAEDSFSLAPVLLGGTTRPVRNYAIQNSYSGAKIIRQVDANGNEWKLVFSSNDGGFSGTAISPFTTISNFSLYQLFNLTSDPGELTNLLAGGGTSAMQQKTLELQTLLQQLITAGRSAPSTVTGDFNGDHFVDLDDYAVWRGSFGSNSLLSADASGNGIIDTADYAIWRKYYVGPMSGSGAGGFPGAAVPEPSTVALMGFAAATFCNCFGRRRPRVASSNRKIICETLSY